MTSVLLIALGAALGAALVAALVLPRARSVAARASADLVAAQSRALSAESRADAERAAHERHVADLRAAAEERVALALGTREQWAAQSQAISATVLAEVVKQQDALAGAQREVERATASGELAKRSTEFQAAIAPLREQLRKLESSVSTLDRERHASQGALQQLLQGVTEEVGRLRSETGSLVSALKRPQVRGSWGEMQLRNAVEAANMTEHVDFAVQRTLDAGDDGRLRPDMIVHLPGGGEVVVDSKVPMEAYLRALECADEAEQATLLDRHAAQLRAHVDALAAKSYHAQFGDRSPDFVVCFVPNEAVYCAALERDPTLLERGAAKDVLIATPMSLLALLKAVAYGWRQERIAESAREIADAGRELHKRIATFLEPFAKVGRHLNTTVNAYNAATSSLEARVLPQLRRMEDAGAASAKPLTPPPAVETPARLLTAPELAGDAASDEPSPPALRAAEAAGPGREPEPPVAEAA
jgi:DNA recombination protein RmuC